MADEVGRSGDPPAEGGAPTGGADDGVPDDGVPGGGVPDGGVSDGGASGDEVPDGEVPDGEVLLGEGQIEPVEIQEELERSFLDYAMSVIVSRALPDARDGLKPVQRRILWSMFEQGIRPDRSHVKCARVVGEVMGRYHPHGDQAIYDALVRMGQSFSLRHPLIDPHGNFGSPSDPPAAMRYTECRLSPAAMRMLEGIDEDTVDFVDNYDGTARQPVVLPSRFPNLLVNGSEGIAVGMATRIPPHNLGEVAAAVIHLIRNPEATADELAEHIRGPDFPTGGVILGRAGIREAYRTGRGTVRIRGRAEIVEGRSGMQIVVTEIPYQTSVEQIEEKAAEQIERRALEGIRAIRNESAKGRTRLVFELKRDANASVVLNNLYRLTPLQTSYPVNMVALVDDVPRTLNLRDALVAYVDHQISVVRRRSEHRLERARTRLHIVEGLLRAIDMIDAVIATIRASEDRSAARAALMAEPFSFSELQANHILEMALGRLTRLGRQDLLAEADELRRTVAELEAILADEGRLREVIVTELTEVVTELGDERRTELTHDPGEFDIEDLIDDEDLVITLSTSGYIKAVRPEVFRTQARGGRGIAAAALKDDDVLEHVVTTSAHAYLLFFTNRGRVLRRRAHEIPVMERTARGRPIVNFLALEGGERVQAVIDTRDYESYRYLVFVTREGLVKKTRFSEYNTSRSAGLIALRLNEGDELVSVVPVNDGDELLLVSAAGTAIRFAGSDVRPMGRAAAGVRGMRLRPGDVVVAAVRVDPDGELLVVTDRGYGKRTPLNQFRTQSRGGHGIRAVRLSPERGRVAAAFVVEPDDEILCVSAQGTCIRVAVADVSVQGRDATGVRIMRLDNGDVLSAVALVRARDEKPPAGQEGEGPPGDEPPA